MASFSIDAILGNSEPTQKDPNHLEAQNRYLLHASKIEGLAGAGKCAFWIVISKVFLV